MPKRKRGSYEASGDRTLARRRHHIEEIITQGKKALHKALKTAKGFERQRLGKRLSNARNQGNDEDIQRITKEIDILKVLDLSKVGEAHLRKTILKVKGFAESELLPEEVRAEVEKPDMGEEDLKAWNNVVSGMLNMKPLKEAMSQILGGLHSELDGHGPSGLQTGETKQSDKRQSKDGVQQAGASEDTNCLSNDDEDDQSDSLVWEGFDARDGEIPDANVEDNGIDIESDNLNEEELSRYDALLGGSSDEESFDEEQYKSNLALRSQGRLSLSQSPTPPSESESESVPSPPPQVTKAPKSKSIAANVGGSTFLPTLMGGYYEGSDSSASDIDEEVVNDIPVKKNRPGQMARQAIWEKKYGQRANHIKKGLGSVAERKAKDDGWDAKRGAKDGDAKGRFGSRRGRGWEAGRAGGGRATGENSTPVGEMKMGVGKKDHDGVLHPSWQAAKKAKEMEKAATFQGKKVVFD
jgi:hypothetical protein